MMNAVIADAPPLFRGALRDMIKRWAENQGLTDIDEDTVYRAVDELAPPGMANNLIKPELDKLRSK